MHNQIDGHSAWVWVVGAIIGLGQLLLADDALTARRVLGRAFVSGGLGASASLLLVWYPDATPAALMGLAAALASLGTSGLETVLRRVGKG
jgi:hypothetical protein